MTTEEPSTRDFLSSMVEVVASNRLVIIIRRKFQAQSFHEFFNRIWGTGLLLFVVGVIGFFVAIILEQYQITLLDITNTLFIVAAAVIAWFILEIVGFVNDAEYPLYGETTPDREVEIVKASTGFVILSLLVYQFFWQSSSPLEILMLIIIAFILVGMILIGGAWFLGGLSGLFRLYYTDGPDS